MILVLPALAQETSNATDTQLLRPSFVAGALPGFDAPRFSTPGTIRVGALVQYEHDPLLLYKFQEEQGAVVAHRDVLDLGLWWQPARRVAFRVTLPVTAQWGGEVETLSDDGVGVGNLSAGLALQAWEAGRLRTAGTIDLYLPTSPTTAWVGDASIRAEGAMLGSFDLGGLVAHLEVGASLRPVSDTGYDFRPGSELIVNPSVRYRAWPDRVEVGTGLLTRWGFTGAATAPVEWIAGLTTHPTRRWQLDLGVGRGLTGGYGTSQLRVYGGVTWQHSPPEPEPEPEPIVAVLAPPSEELTEVDIAPPPDPPPPALARIEREQIVIRDPIQFEFGTDRILPVSQPTLEAIKLILDANPEVLHVVIEGHASEEGSYLYNYDLSLRRSIAIFRALVDVGVHPARLSCRGMGEVVPAAAGADELALAANRRVIFHIVRRLEPGEAYPDWGTERRVPWTGASEPWVTPVVAPPPAPPAPVTPPPPESFPDFREEEDDTPFGTEEEEP